jgi:SAM-dependent methyltransferase
MQTSATNTFACDICGLGMAVEIPAFREFHRVTSDCRPWPSGGRLGVCNDCGGVQKPADTVFLREIDDIYSNYVIYHQGKGAEQAVFEQGSGLPVSRSSRLMETFRSHWDISKIGRMLDVGCGNGAMLRAFGHVAPAWTLAGTELNDKYRREVEAIPQTEPLHVCPVDRILGTFNVITMIHVLEHIIHPVEFLASLLPKLSHGGVVLIEVPHYLENPFELLIADHRSHFTAATLSLALQKAGYEVVTVATDWIAKELSVIARVAPHDRNAASEPTVAAAGESVQREIEGTLDWLNRTVEAARDLSRGTRIGLFGTSIAGTWLCSEIADGVGFFVDEDSNRIGATHMNRPVLSPPQLSPNTTVFVGLPPAIAAGVCQRLKTQDVKYCPPPA